jgi:hypothetical protein
VFKVTQAMSCPCLLNNRKRELKIPDAGVLPLELTDFDDVHVLTGLEDVGSRNINPFAVLSISTAIAKPSAATSSLSTGSSLFFFLFSCFLFFCSIPFCFHTFVSVHHITSSVALTSSGSSLSSSSSSSKTGFGHSPGYSSLPLFYFSLLFL